MKDIIKDEITKGSLSIDPSLVSKIDISKNSSTIIFPFLSSASEGSLSKWLCQFTTLCWSMGKYIPEDKIYVSKKGNIFNQDSLCVSIITELRENMVERIGIDYCRHNKINQFLINFSSASDAFYLITLE